jgi:aryl-alcohol dehydrogenase-like predicted oxidoreductase
MTQNAISKALKMDMRPLGRSGLIIAPLVLGTNVFGWTADEKTSHAILDAFVEAGFNALDTANSYSRWVPGHGGGESETIIGNWLKRSGKRAEVVVATKVGSDMGEGNTIRKDAILREAEASLRRLQTDRIDLYQTHFDDDVTPVEETLAAYAQLIAQGKVRAIGASNVTPERLTVSLAVAKRDGLPRYESLQPLYNIYNRKEFESEYLAICQREQIGVIDYYALAAGFLTGKYRSVEETDANKARSGRLKRYANPRGFKILDALADVAGRHGASSAQIALAWLIARPSVTAPIASATSVTQLGEIMKAPGIRLSADDMAVLDKASA